MDDNVFDLSLLRTEALGWLLGGIDAMLAFDAAGYPMERERMARLRELRDNYTKADKAYRDARLARLG